jgi:formamidopyrimidine-DNA glycosylase
MPELPEVETVRRGLQPVLEGARLSRVEQRRPDLRFPFPEGFVQRLTGARIERLERRAKYLLGHLDRGDVLVMHLGMTGRFEIEAPGLAARPGDFVHAVAPDPKHAHVLFETEVGALRALPREDKRDGHALGRRRHAHCDVLAEVDHRDVALRLAKCFEKARKLRREIVRGGRYNRRTVAPVAR